MEVEALDTADPSVEDVEGDPFLQHHPSSGRSRSLSESNDGTSGNGKSKLYGHRGSTSSSLSWNSSHQLETMYKMRPVLCDVCLRADDGHKVYGHRIVLASAMHYFSSMFIGCTTVGATTTTTVPTASADCYASMETDTNGGAGDQPDYWGPSTSSATALTQLAVPSTSTSSAMAVHPPPTTIFPSNSFVEQQQFEIAIHNVDGRSLEELIKYCYLGTVAISEETVQSLLAAATMLAATDVIALCADYLRVRLQAANALGIHQFAELVGCLELKEAAFGYILNHFVRISSSSSSNDGTSTSSAVNEEFLALTPDRLAEILSSDHLDTGEAGEPEVLRALNTWIAADPDRRRPFLPQLIKHIRFPKFSQEALICIEAEYPLLRPEPALKDLLIEAMRFHLCKNSTATGHHHFNHHLQFSSQRMFSDSLRLSNLCSGGGEAGKLDAPTQNPNQSSSSSSSPSASTSSATATTSSSWTPSLPPNLPQMFDLTNARFRERIPRIRQKCLLVVGGQAPKAIRQCEYLDFGRCKWAELPPGGELPSRRCRSGIAVLNGLIYAIGGFNGQIRVRTVDVYDPKLNSWTQAASLEARRSTLGAAVLNGLLYAVGGFDGTIGLQSAEVYSPLARSWRPIASMSTRRSSVAVAALGGLLYAVGGYDGASRQCLASVEAYCPATDSWRAVADMSQRRSGAGVGVLEGRRLYAIGGHDGPAVRKSVECFDAETGAWSQCADMVVARRNAGVVVREGKLYVVGGDDGQSNLATVEVYDPKANQWTLLPTAMSIGRSYAGVVLVDKTWSQ